MILKNTLREKLDQGASTLGTHFLFTDPDIAEMVGDLGLFDYAEVCAEYSVVDMQTLYHQARAAQCGNLPLMLKPDQAGQAFWTQAAMGAGFKAVLFTDIRTPQDVSDAHDIIRADTPTSGGLMGVKLRRPALANYDTEEYGKDLDAFVFAIMIEKQATLDDLDAVLDSARDAGVDMTQWGPADFGFSRGQPGLMAMPEIRPFEELVISKSLEYGIRPRIEIGGVEQAKRYLDLGVKDFCIGWDRFILRSALQDLGEGMRNILGEG
ncbi:MAG: 2-keto-3-deoxy-L-rhamnonate aldolase RhmA [Limisphaerales bacterium]